MSKKDGFEYPYPYGCVLDKEGDLAPMEARLQQAVHEFLRRNDQWNSRLKMARKPHSKNKYEIDPDELLYCCHDIDQETTWRIRWIKPLYRHLRSFRHVANMYCVDDRELARRVRAYLKDKLIMEALAGGEELTYRYKWYLKGKKAA